jgi:hypothetical protein
MREGVAAAFVSVLFGLSLFAAVTLWPMVEW